MDSVEIKICGLTNRVDAEAALAMGADYLGFVLYGGSPRGVSTGVVGRILSELGSGVKGVGVFVNEPASAVAAWACECGLHAVQIHGDEAAEGFGDMPVPVWRALRIEGGSVVPDPGRWPASRFVVDASVPGLYGGTGVVADWESAARLAAEHPVMLAGGLTPGNVVDAMCAVQPLGVDVSSGVEAAPGKKDHVRMQQFIDAVRHTGTVRNR